MNNEQFEHALHPELKASLGLLQPLQLPEQLEQARQLRPPAMEPNERVTIQEYYIVGGSHQSLRIRVYVPVRSTDSETTLPGLLWTHGGGYILGTLEGEDRLCVDMADTAGCIIVSPDYRLAPEHPYPAGLEDAYTALCWMVDPACPLPIRADRLAVGGASAGGGLAAALALLARDRRGPKLCFQLLLYPMIDYRNDTASSHEIHHPLVWNREYNLIAWKLYLGHDPANHAEFITYYESPSLAPDLTGLPPAYLCVGQLDPFRDETIQYATRLAQSSIATELHVQPGAYHGFENVALTATPSQRFRNAYIQALVRALND